MCVCSQLNLPENCRVVFSLSLSLSHSPSVECTEKRRRAAAASVIHRAGVDDSNERRLSVSFSVGGGGGGGDGLTLVKLSFSVFSDDHFSVFFAFAFAVHSLTTYLLTSYLAS